MNTTPTRRVTLNPEQTALVMVDMQNDFCHPEGFYARNGDRMGSIGLQPSLVSGALSPMKELLAAARAAGLFVIHTQIIRDPDAFNTVQTLHQVMPRTSDAYKDAPGQPPLVPGSWGADTHRDLAPLPGEYTVVKRAFSAFYQTDLELVLRRRGIRCLVIAGTITYACVLHTIFDAYVRDFDVVVPSDGVASWAPDLQDPTLRIVDLILGATLTTDELVRLLSGDRAGAFTSASP